MKFCDNKLCRLHSVEIDGPQIDVCEYVEANGKKVRARRFILADKGNPGPTWALCDICAHAVAMIHSGK